MTVIEFIETANLVAVISVPAIGALMSWFHRQNSARWEMVHQSIEETKIGQRKARKGQRKLRHEIELLRQCKIDEHDKLWGRLNTLEQQIKRTIALRTGDIQTSPQ